MVYVFVVLYIVVLILISVFTAKKAKNTDEYLLGGRAMGPWISAFAYGTTYFSSVIFVGYAGQVGYNNGIAGILIGLGNAFIGSLLAWFVLARRTRHFTGKYNISTMPEFFEKRYGSKAMKIVTAVIIFVFLVPYCASVYQGLSYMFEMALGIPYAYVMIAMAALTALYLFFGGYMSTAIANFFQGVVMIVGVTIMVVMVLNHPAVGGIQNGLAQLEATSPKLVSFGWANVAPVMIMVLLTSFGSWGLPQMVHKFYTIKDDKSIKIGMVISTVFALLIATSAYFIGAFGRFFVTAQEAANTSNIVPLMISRALPELMVGLVVALVLSASMSTLSSLILVSSSSISIDLVGAFRPNIQQKQQVLIMRILCLVFVLFSLLVALNKNNAILTLMSYSWGTLSGCFLAPFLYGLYWKGTTKIGAWAGIVCGLLTTGILFFVMKNAPLTGVISMTVSTIVVPLVSLITPKYSKDFLESIKSE